MLEYSNISYRKSKISETFVSVNSKRLASQIIGVKDKSGGKRNSRPAQMHHESNQKNHDTSANKIVVCRKQAQKIHANQNKRKDALNFKLIISLFTNYFKDNSIYEEFLMEKNNQNITKISEFKRICDGFSCIKVIFDSANQDNSCSNSLKFTHIFDKVEVLFPRTIRLSSPYGSLVFDDVKQIIYKESSLIGEVFGIVRGGTPYGRDEIYTIVVQDCDESV